METSEDYIPTHAQVISSPLVVRWAIDSVGLDQLPSLVAAKAAGKNPVEQAIDNLKVVRTDRQAKILRVDYYAGSKDEAVRMLEAITNSYRKFLEGTCQKNSNEVITLIVKARDDLSKELTELEAKYLALRQNARILTVSESGRSFAAHRLEADRPSDQRGAG